MARRVTSGIGGEGHIKKEEMRMGGWGEGNRIKICVRDL